MDESDFIGRCLTNVQYPIGESLDIKIDSSNESLKPLLSWHRIAKSLKSVSSLCNKRWPETLDGLHYTIFLVKNDVPKCPPDPTLRWHSVLP